MCLSISQYSTDFVPKTKHLVYKLFVKQYDDKLRGPFYGGCFELTSGMFYTSNRDSTKVSREERKLGIISLGIHVFREYHIQLFNEFASINKLPNLCIVECEALPEDLVAFSINFEQAVYTKVKLNRIVGYL